MMHTPPHTRLPALLLAGLTVCTGLIGLTCVTGCAGTDTDAPSATESAGAAPRPERTRASAKGLDFTETFEIRFGKELVGYLVDVLETPEGVIDTRAYLPGTALIESRDLELLGFISPRGTSYRFRADGTAEAVGYGTRDRNIAAFFARSESPDLVTLHHGTVPGR
jgi:hypothetical protein